MIQVLHIPNRLYLVRILLNRPREAWAGLAVPVVGGAGDISPYRQLLANWLGGTGAWQALAGPQQQSQGCPTNIWGQVRMAVW